MRNEENDHFGVWRIGGTYIAIFISNLLNFPFMMLFVENLEIKENPP
jgi:hypothetical protein